LNSFDPIVTIIDQILEEDKPRTKKQRHTTKPVHECLRDEHGFTGDIAIVTDYVRERMRRTHARFVLKKWLKARELSVSDPEVVIGHRMLPIFGSMDHNSARL